MQYLTYVAHGGADHSHAASETALLSFGIITLITLAILFISIMWLSSPQKLQPQEQPYDDVQGRESEDKQ